VASDDETGREADHRQNVVRERLIFKAVQRVFESRGIPLSWRM
jgi:hypothetical protein